MFNVLDFAIFNKITLEFCFNVVCFTLFGIFLVLFGINVLFPNTKGRYLYIVAEILTVITILKVIIQFILRL